MKTTLIVFAFLSIIIHGNCQSGQVFMFKQIGLTFTVPEGFKLLDSTSHKFNPNPEIEVSLKQLVFQNNNNNISFIVSSSTQKGIDWNNIHIKESKHFYDQTRIRKPETKFDSSSTTMMVGSQSFNKFIITGKENNLVTYNHVDLSKYYKGYKVHISYFYSSPEMRNELEKALTSSKFLE